MKNTDIAETCAIIATELNKKQPVLLSGGQHAFICDGYRDGYFHLNLGWRGAANGYYKFLLDEDLKDKETTEGIIKEIVFDISPDHGDKNLSKIVSVNSSGTLCNKLSSIPSFHSKHQGKYGEKEGNYHKGLFEGNNTYTCKGVIHNGEILRNIEYKIIY